MFFVAFGGEVTKILRNSLFTFLLSKARQAKRKRKSRKQNDKKLKTKLPKFVKSQAIVAHYYFLHFIFQEKEEKAWVSKNKSHFNDIDDFDLSFD